mgnify:CR=1 FL=1
MDGNLQMSDIIIQASLYIKRCRGRAACPDFLNTLPGGSQRASAGQGCFLLIKQILFTI